MMKTACLHMGYGPWKEFCPADAGWREELVSRQVSGHARGASISQPGRGIILDIWAFSSKSGLQCTLELRSSGDASMELYSPELGQAWSAPSGCKPLTCSESGGPWNTKEEGAEQMVSLG